MEDKKLKMKNLHNRKMNNKGTTLTAISLMIVVGIFAFVALFAFISDNANQSGITIDERYNESYNKILEEQGNLSSLTVTIRDAGQAVSEARLGDFGFFGLKGILQVMLLPFGLLNIALDSVSIGLGVSDYIPPSVINAISLGVSIIIIFAVIAFLTQRQRDP